MLTNLGKVQSWTSLEKGGKRVKKKEDCFLASFCFSYSCLLTCPRQFEYDPISELTSRTRFGWSWHFYPLSFLFAINPSVFLPLFLFFFPQLFLFIFLSFFLPSFLQLFLCFSTHFLSSFFVSSFSFFYLSMSLFLFSLSFFFFLSLFFICLFFLFLSFFFFSLSLFFFFFLSFFFLCLFFSFSLFGFFLFFLSFFSSSFLPGSKE